MKALSNKKVFVSFALLIMVAVVIYLGTTVIPKALITLSKAESQEDVSVANSLIIGQKLLAKANGEDSCVVNVFVLDKEGRGIKGKTVELTGYGVQEEITDSLGKATFNIISLQAKQYSVSARVDGLILNDSVTVTFK
jgi:hypothetical protein